MPVFRDLWGPQQQIARRHAIEQTSVDLGLADADPTVQDRDRAVVANPHQLRWRDSTLSVIGANQQWARKRLSTNEVGSADGDPTVKPPWADGSAYLWAAPRQPDTIAATNAWARLRLTTNDLGAADGDPTVRPPWADGEAFYWPAPRQPDAITATNAWRFNRLTSNDLGTTDADPTVNMPWIYEHPFSAYWRDPTVTAIEAVHQALRRRLSTNELGSADQDTSVRPLWQTANPYQLRAGLSPLPAVGAMLAQYHLWQASTPVEVSADPTVRPPVQDPYQRRRADPAVWSVEAFEQWMRVRVLPTATVYGPDIDYELGAVVTKWRGGEPFTAWVSGAALRAWLAGAPETD